MTSHDTEKWKAQFYSKVSVVDFYETVISHCVHEAKQMWPLRVPPKSSDTRRALWEYAWDHCSPVAYILYYSLEKDRGYATKRCLQELHDSGYSSYKLGMWIAFQIEKLN